MAATKRCGCLYIIFIFMANMTRMPESDPSSPMPPSYGFRIVRDSYPYAHWQHVFQKEHHSLAPGLVKGQPPSNKKAHQSRF